MELSHPQPASSPRTASHASTPMVVSAWAGIVGPVLFTVAFLVQERLRRAEFDPIAEPVSALEAGPAGWVQQVSFVVFGVLTLVHAAGLHRAVRPAPRGWIGPALLATSGVALVLGGAVFPLREDVSGTTYDPGGHAVAGTTFFLSSALALLALWWRFRRDEAWAGLSRYTLGAGAAAAVAFVAMGALVMPDAAPLHEWAGLAQRAVILLIVFPCRVLVALRMRAVVLGHRA